MDDLGAPRHEFELLRRDIQLLEERLRRELAERLNEQTKTLFRTFIVSNAAMVLAVATLAFGAARFA
jgi:mannose/cellobiose epimerase-like protein (N-acyl-D-glucosamine 2-epimerase family)